LNIRNKCSYKLRRKFSYFIYSFDASDVSSLLPCFAGCDHAEDILEHLDTVQVREKKKGIVLLLFFYQSK
jgi:hypothetical protein